MKLWRIIWQWIIKGAPKAISTVTKPAEPVPAWDAFLWPQYMDHGYEGENEMRHEGIRLCREAGKTCLGITIKRLPSYPFAIEVLDWESDKQSGKFVGKFHKAATEAGITHWQVDIASIGDYAAVADFFKHYAAGTVRYVGADFGKCGKALECDANGIKTTPPRMRQ
jgi:hypothetical protein